MPIATPEQLKLWEFDVSVRGTHAVVYLSDGQIAKERDRALKYHGIKKTLDDIMHAEIIACGFKPEAVRRFSDEPYLCQRSTNTLVYAATMVEG